MTSPGMKLRTGRKLGRTVYLQAGPEPSDEDELLALFLNPIWAVRIVKIVNGETPATTQGDPS